MNVFQSSRKGEENLMPVWWWMLMKSVLKADMTCAASPLWKWSPLKTAQSENSSFELLFSQTSLRRKKSSVKQTGSSFAGQNTRKFTMHCKYVKYLLLIVFSRLHYKGIIIVFFILSPSRLTESLLCWLCCTCKSLTSDTSWKISKSYKLCAAHQLHSLFWNYYQLHCPY